MQNFLGSVIAETYVIELDSADDIGQRQGAIRVPIFRALAMISVRALKSSQSLGDLRPDGDYLHDGRDQKHKIKVVRDVAAGSKSVPDHLTSAHIHGGGADYAEEHAGGKTHQRCSRERAHDVVEQPAHAHGKGLLLAFFGVVSLHHADAAERFG